MTSTDRNVLINKIVAARQADVAHIPTRCYNYKTHTQLVAEHREMSDAALRFWEEQFCR